ncbi:hypothetical protein, partial [Trabulsiella guamensis]|uniref:hypothetical protein n=1 Tax=Trabulsiella guamensis TaxID=158852 RepID=UPI00146FFFC1
RHHTGDPAQCGHALPDGQDGSLFQQCVRGLAEPVAGHFRLECEGGGQCLGEAETDNGEGLRHLPVDIQREA